MERVSHTTSHKFSVGRAFGWIALVAVLGSFMLSNIDSLLKFGLIVAAVFVGAIAGPRIFPVGDHEGEVSRVDPNVDARINSASIPVRGGIGAGILILILLTGALLDLPELRWLALPGIVAGLIAGGVLVLWRRHQGY